ncbi:MAG: hypothetical protein ACOYJK_09480 [Prevotella sp.]|jgi:hypothetical protein
MLYFKFYDKSYKGVPPLHKKCRTPWGKLLNRLNKMFCPNPNFDDKIPYVVQWFVEYDDIDYHQVVREIGFDFQHHIIVKLPDKRNYGFWIDSNMEIENFKKDFDIQMATKQEFNNLWESVYYDR